MDALEIEHQFQTSISGLDFDYAHPANLLPFPQEIISQAIIDNLETSLHAAKVNSMPAFADMAIDQATFLLNALSMFSSDVSSKVSISDMRISEGLKMAELNEKYQAMLEEKTSNF